jgi:hypothetical protein
VWQSCSSIGDRVELVAMIPGFNFTALDFLVKSIGAVMDSNSWLAWRRLAWVLTRELRLPACTNYRIVPRAPCANLGTPPAITTHGYSVVVHKAFQLQYTRVFLLLQGTAVVLCNCFRIEMPHTPSISHTISHTIASAGMNIAVLRGTVTR